MQQRISLFPPGNYLSSWAKLQNNNNIFRTNRQQTPDPLHYQAASCPCHTPPPVSTLFLNPDVFPGFLCLCYFPTHRQPHPQGKLQAESDADKGTHPDPRARVRSPPSPRGRSWRGPETRRSQIRAFLAPPHPGTGVGGVQPSSWGPASSLFPSLSDPCPPIDLFLKRGF